jgi:hypothetical protein
MTLHLNVTLRVRPLPSTTTELQQPPHPDAVRIKHTPNFLDGYAMLSPLHAQAMVNGILGPPVVDNNKNENDDNDDSSNNDNDSAMNSVDKKTSTSSCPCPLQSSDIYNDDDNDNVDNTLFLQLPRIAILNRQVQHKRSLLNVQELANALEDAIITNATAAAASTTANMTTNNTTSLWTVPIVYFENATFLQQLQFFAHYDIVITGHGAQLTGLPFMRQPPPSATAAAAAAAASQSTPPIAASTTCRASIVEIFPFGYCMPSFFGSLAVASGHDHYYVSMENNKRLLQEQQQQGNNNMNADNPYCFLNIKRRVQKRQVNLCPNWDGVVQGILQIVQEWNDNNCSSRRGRRRRHVCSCP